MESVSDKFGRRPARHCFRTSRAARAPRGGAAYERQVAEAADGLPVPLYLRDDSGGLDAIAPLCPIPGVAGVKWATPKLMNLAAARRAAPHLARICGLAEPWAPPMTALGARGFTSGVINLAPHLSMPVLRALETGDSPAAQEAILAIEPFETLRAAEGNGANVLVVKAALALAGEDVGAARPPAAWPLSPTALAALASLAVTAMISFSARARQLAGSAQINLLVALVSVGLTGGVTTAFGMWALPVGAAGWLGVVVAGLVLFEKPEKSG